MTGEANLTLKAAAQRLGISPFTLRGWAIYQRKIPYLRLGRRILFRPSDIQKFEAEHLVPAAPAR